VYVIYVLIDPRDNTVRYVGVTEDVSARFQQHINCAAANYAKNAWIHELRAANKMVIMQTLEEVEDRERALEREGYWITHFEMLREPVMNICKTSSPRRSKKTNLRVGRQISMDIASAAVQAIQLAHLAYPAVRDVPAGESPRATTPTVRLVVRSASDVPDETRETIRCMKQAGEPDRKIARFVGLSGRKYTLYQSVCRELGFVAEQQTEGEV
jgi:predicted GIY-YIG superfamily endonuclease